MSQFIDRRQQSSKKSTVNRQRFLKRFKNQIKKAVTDAVNKRGITDIEQGEQITIPSKDLMEPTFTSGQGGNVDKIFPGNDSFQTGDKIKRSPPHQSGVGQGEASAEGEGSDPFVFDLSKDEFLELFFEDLELPDLIKKELSKLCDWQKHKAGVSHSGTPTNINIIRSMRQATGRRIALGGQMNRELQELETLLETKISEEKRKSIVQRIEILRRKLAHIAFIDTMDIRYNHFVKIPKPSTQAVMFCIMDVSGSMDEAKKEIAKRFFILLYLFLTKNYEHIELVFIRHHTAAKAVDEKEFFYSRETGGTVVSSALELLQQLMEKKYSTKAWNIYVAQASDGDNWNADSPYCGKILQEKILPYIQYYAYVEIMPRHHQSLWEIYQGLTEHHKHFASQTIHQVNEIYPVFRELFKRKSS
ncbi:MAG: YeaH/YhbH family protein [Gammaproteobacteria bacterium]|nr:YeaH/YhbH family protein [Gammaproteobacteria bacterium]